MKPEYRTGRYVCSEKCLEVVKEKGKLVAKSPYLEFYEYGDYIVRVDVYKLGWSLKTLVLPKQIFRKHVEELNRIGECVELTYLDNGGVINVAGRNNR